MLGFVGDEGEWSFVGILLFMFLVGLYVKCFVFVFSEDDILFRYLMIVFYIFMVCDVFLGFMLCFFFRIVVSIFMLKDWYFVCCGWIV